MIENKRFKASKICKNERKAEVRRNGSRQIEAERHSQNESTANNKPYIENETKALR